MKTLKAVTNRLVNRSSRVVTALLVLATLVFTQQARAWVHSGDLTINSQAQLDGLAPGLEEVTGRLVIGVYAGFSDITDLSALTALKTAEGLSILRNSSLTNLDGLATLQTLAGSGLWIAVNSSLTNLDGLAALQTAAGMTIIGNASLTNLDGLASLQTIAGMLQIYNNGSLTNINGIAGTQAVTRLYIADNGTLASFCGLYNIALNSAPGIYWEISGNFVNPTRQEVIDNGPCVDPFSGTVIANAFYDANGNGMVDPGEKGIKDVIIRHPNAAKTTKHLTLQNGKAKFRNLPEGENSFYVDMNSLPDGVQPTTEPSLHVNLSPENSYVNIYFGFSGDLSGREGDDAEVPANQMEEKCNPLVFVKGTPTYSNGKNSYGWENAVDCDVCSEAGATLAQPDATNGATVPWAIFQFQDGGMYKFDYIRFQTGFCDGEQKLKMAYETSRIEVLVSETGMDAGDFVSVGTFSSKYSQTELQWGRLAGETKAKYIKLRLLSPVANGAWTQIVEFAVDNSDKTGPQPASTEQDVALVQSHELLTNYPNPFNPTTTIEYNLERDSQVSLRIYDLTGKQVAELVNGYVSAGSHQTSWNAANMPSGVYFMSLQSGTNVVTRRMLLMK